jgi:transposase InsO family protein
VLQVSPSGYYAWSTRVIGRRAKQNEQLLVEIQRMHEESRQSYGSIKIWKALNAQGIRCGKHRIARLRRINGIETRRRRRFKVTTRSKNNQWIEPNLLNRCFHVQRPNQVWVGDVTFIATRTGWLYLAILIDLYSRKVIGWSMSNKNDKHLVLNALDMAVARRQPKSGVLHHTDRGAIYAADEYRQKLSSHQLISSMSRKADCYDNAVAESFFSTLKNELDFDYIFESRDQARTEVFKYIEIFYNRQRIHQALNYLTPEKMEALTVT